MWRSRKSDRLLISKTKFKYLIFQRNEKSIYWSSFFTLGLFYQNSIDHKLFKKSNSIINYPRNSTVNFLRKLKVDLFFFVHWLFSNCLLSMCMFFLIFLWNKQLLLIQFSQIGLFLSKKVSIINYPRNSTVNFLRKLKVDLFFLFIDSFPTVCCLCICFFWFSCEINSCPWSRFLKLGYFYQKSVNHKLFKKFNSIINCSIVILYFETQKVDFFFLFFFCVHWLSLFQLSAVYFYVFCYACYSACCLSA